MEVAPSYKQLSLLAINGLYAYIYRYMVRALAYILYMIGLWMWRNGDRTGGTKFWMGCTPQTVITIRQRVILKVSIS